MLRARLRQLQVPPAPERADFRLTMSMAATIQAPPSRVLNVN